MENELEEISNAFRKSPNDPIVLWEWCKRGYTDKDHDEAYDKLKKKYFINVSDERTNFY